MRLLAIALTILSVAGLYLPLFRQSYWWIRVFDYPQFHVVVFAVISLVLLFVSFGYKNPVTWSLAITLSVGIALRLPRILNYTPLSPVNVKEALVISDNRTLRIIQCNIRMDNRQSDKVRKMVLTHRPDVVLIVEANRWWLDELALLDSIYEYTVKQPLENTYGMLLYSKYELIDTEVNFLVKDEIPSIYTKVVLPSGDMFDLYCLHPEPPRPGSDTYERDAELLIVGKRIRKSGNPAMVVGDMNDVAWSHTSELFQRYSGLLDPREGRGFYNTYNAFIPLFRYPLDHFFFSEEFGLISLRKLEAIGSDHFPMMMEVMMDENTDHSQNKENPDKEDIEDVNSKIDEGIEKEQKREPR